MAKKKNYYYVLVCTTYGAVFVTDILPKHNAEWDKEKTPMEFTREYAKDVVLGLGLNGYLAYLVCQPYKLTHQPYRYDLGEFKWVENDA